MLSQLRYAVLVHGYTLWRGAFPILQGLVMPSGRVDTAARVSVRTAVSAVGRPLIFRTASL